MSEPKPSIDVIVGCLIDGCVCCSEFGKCTRCYAAETIRALTAERDRLKGRLALAVAMLRPHYEDDYLQQKFGKALGGDA